jgi:hypothetical protein
MDRSMDGYLTPEMAEQIAEDRKRLDRIAERLCSAFKEDWEFRPGDMALFTMNAGMAGALSFHGYPDGLSPEETAGLAIRQLLQQANMLMSRMPAQYLLLKLPQN